MTHLWRELEGVHRGMNCMAARRAFLVSTPTVPDRLKQSSQGEQKPY
jgi:hypothetical protein